MSVALAFLAISLSVSRAANPRPDRESTPGTVYTASNASTGNEVFAYARAFNGSLTFSAAYATGGTGNDVELGGLGNQEGVVLSSDGHWLLVVNPGSNDVSAFAVQSDGSLSLTDTESSGGVLPTSVTISRNLVYVLNAADVGTIARGIRPNEASSEKRPGTHEPV